MRASAVAGLILAAAILPAGAQTRPGGPTIPSPAEVLGYELGERFTPHAGIVRYIERLDAASPRVQTRRYGTSVEGRPLLQVVVAREDHLARLDEILDRNRELTEPGTAEARAREIARSNPLVLYFQYGVHGNESSSAEAALWTAWDLARGAERVAGVLDSAVVVIDPTVNPDGRDRYVYGYMQARGVEPNPRPESREHDEPWPGGRFNHYLFDLNRDWAVPSQPETVARLASWGYWSPQVEVDFHEMSPLSTYFFFPPADPVNPIYPEHLHRWARYFGEANAAAFDAQGWPYFTEESYDWFAPIYGDSWPSLLGAIGMTYEQAGGGRAGLAYRRPGGQVLTLRDRALHHWTSGAATARAAAFRKTALLEDFARFHRTQGAGLPDVLLVPGTDPARLEALVEALRREGVRVERAGQAFRASAEPHTGFDARRDFPAGTYRVPARQPRGRLAVTLLQPETLLKATYSYDISAWSLPYVFGVEAHSVRRPVDARWVQVPGTGPAFSAPEVGFDLPRLRADAGVATGAPPQPRVGFLVAPGMAAWPGVVRYLRAGGRAVVLEDSFTAAGRHWPAGTIFLPRHDIERQAEKIAASGLVERAVAVESGLTPSGRDLGTGESVAIRLPRVAVIAGEGVSPTSYGAHWFFLENTLGLPFDAVNAGRLPDLDLDDYDVVVLPEMSGRALGDTATERLKDWVERGGTVVAVGGGAAAIAQPIADVELRKAEPETDQDLDRALRGRKARELEDWETGVPGTVLQLRLDPAHPLAYGAGADGDAERMFVLQVGSTIFEPSTEFETVAAYPAGLEKVSGVISKENLERLAQGSWLVTRRVGRGRAILFANDPLFRHFWYSAFQPYANALLVGPTM